MVAVVAVVAVVAAAAAAAVLPIFADVFLSRVSRGRSGVWF